MTTFRSVPMSAEQAETLNRVVIPALMRAGEDQRASQMMALALAWKFAPEPEGELPSNVYPLVKHAGDSWSRKVVS